MMRMRRRGTIWREEAKKAYADKLKFVAEQKPRDKWAELEARLNEARRLEASDYQHKIGRRRASTSQLPDSFSRATPKLPRDGTAMVIK